MASAGWHLHRSRIRSLYQRPRQTARKLICFALSSEALVRHELLSLRRSSCQGYRRKGADDDLEERGVKEVSLRMDLRS